MRGQTSRLWRCRGWAAVRRRRCRIVGAALLHCAGLGGFCGQDISFGTGLGGSFLSSGVPLLGGVVLVASCDWLGFFPGVCATKRRIAEKPRPCSTQVNATVHFGLFRPSRFLFAVARKLGPVSASAQHWGLHFGILIPITAVYLCRALRRILSAGASELRWALPLPF